MREHQPKSVSPILDATLYVVATPIGNLQDISARALQVLTQVKLIAAEDTRHSEKLLQHYHISTPMISYHDHSSEAQHHRLCDRLARGESMALISDAGTPLISDPGYRLVAAVRAAGYRVVPIPGPSALIAALCAAGLPTDRFSFEGFPPSKTAARAACFESLKRDQRTLVFYEAPHRIAESLAAMADSFGAERKAVLARELSKTYETFLTGSLSELCTQLAADPNQSRGEMVVIVAGYVAETNVDQISPEAEKLMRLLLDELPVKRAARIAATFTGEKKNKLYQWALQLNES